MPNLTASIPHQLGRAEAKRRLQEQIGILRQEHGAKFTVLKETWKGDTMDFSATAMGQSISGYLTVDENVIHLNVALPWLLSMLAGSMKQKIEQQVTHMLALPAAPAK
jgi:hypothetical protein